MSINQHTLKACCSFEGKGLHTGTYSHMKVLPAAADTGILFRRTDLEGAPVIPALAENVTSTARSTTIACGEAQAVTIEHIMSVLTGMGVDNAVIELDNLEVPILDGSARLYIEAFLAVGLEDQGVPRRYIDLPEGVELLDNRTGSWVRIEPADHPSADITVDFNSQVLGVQTAHWDEETDYAREIGPCRTFCFLHEIMPQLMLGLIKGGDVNNAIVIIDKPVSRCRMRRLGRILRKDVPEVLQPGFLADGGLRFPDECARHKLLDLIGDMRLCGGMPAFRIEAYKAGHSLNTALAREILKNL